jgi:hypothetical protein
MFVGSRRGEQRGKFQINRKSAFREGCKAAETAKFARRREITPTSSIPHSNVQYSFDNLAVSTFDCLNCHQYLVSGYPVAHSQVTVVQTLLATNRVQERVLTPARFIAGSKTSKTFDNQSQLLSKLKFLHHRAKRPRTFETFQMVLLLQNLKIPNCCETISTKYIEVCHQTSAIPSASASQCKRAKLGKYPVSAPPTTARQQHEYHRNTIFD